MATAPIYSFSGLLGLRFSHVLLAFWCTFVGSGSAVTVSQTPSFVTGSNGKTISFRCSVDERTYSIFLYHQLPGKTELKALGYLPPVSTKFEGIPSELTNQLKTQGTGQDLRFDLSNLQANNTGLYLCAGVYTVKEKGTVAGAKLRNKSALYSFPFISIFYLTSMGSPLLHPSGLIFKTAFGQFMPFGCPELPFLHRLWDETFGLINNKTTRTILHNSSVLFLLTVYSWAESAATHLICTIRPGCCRSAFHISHCQPDLSRLLSKKRWIQSFSYKWNLKTWCP